MGLGCGIEESGVELFRLAVRARWRLQALQGVFSCVEGDGRHLGVTGSGYSAKPAR